MKTVHKAKCVVREGLPEERDSLIDFVRENHRQSIPELPEDSDFVVLTYRDEIVGVTIFCSPRTSKKMRLYSKELLRMCFKKDLRILEGASAMVDFYKENFNPFDFFTYQDTTGAASKVYEHCGMTLVSEDKEKFYLVAPGKTFATGSRKEILGLPYAVQYGPDRILGTNLGEIFRDDGSKKSNKELFIEELGWHEEKTSGDRVYEWINPDFTYYTYRITASDSDKYYYGVSHLKKKEASFEECLNDGYFGSGGVKFQNWKSLHKAFLIKEIDKVFIRRSDAFDREEELVGELFRIDENCLNSQRGGIISGGSWKSQKVTLKKCLIHGEIKHRNNNCLKCQALKSIHFDECSIHGKTKFQGSLCLKCKINSSIFEKLCEVHGMTIHRGNSCVKCLAPEKFYQKFCEIHGETSFKGDSCVKCSFGSSISIKNCSVHGETKHFGDSCMRCSRNGVFTEGHCDIHGKVTLEAGKCVKCKSDKIFIEDSCPIHGLTKFRSGMCVKCSQSESWTEQKCSIHGITKFFGNQCWKCKNSEQVKEKVCPIHGKSKFVGEKCYSCTNSKAIKMENCSIHGETKFQGDRCSKCAQAKRFSIKHCEIHGNTKFNGNSCFKCVAQRRKEKKAFEEKS